MEGGREGGGRGKEEGLSKQVDGLRRGRVGEVWVPTLDGIYTV